ncbi:DUF350 domain-containing protein [Microvirga mediterraneensis]|uniref:DUF350 domain-containing protein n=1 Tax=Microvirga mediterraneensis TaxID=2754695 RepID=A0A838BS56_9HYPH|nr:DUF350 domain-containing protein [Microvirga mediterraneensis]MBA1157879.1 DUF350 domain-containing protein [Microvirga mediterraneensis]
MLASSLTGLSAFAIYLVTALAMVGAFGTVYTLITPHREFHLLRSGCTAAVPAFLGAIIGYVIPLSAAMRWSASLADFVIWASIAACVQILAYGATRLLVPDVSKRISANDVAAGILLGGIALAFGMLNAASMTP